MIGPVIICGMCVCLCYYWIDCVWTSCNMWGVSVYVTTGLTVFGPVVICEVCLSMLLLD